MQKNKILLAVGGIVLGLVVGIFIGDRYGLPLHDSGQESQAQTPSDLPRCPRGTTFVGMYTGSDGSTYAGCRNTKGVVNLYLW